MYIKYSDFTGVISESDILLMSRDEFINGGKGIKGVCISVTPDGNEPIEVAEEIAMTEPITQPELSTEERITALEAENAELRAAVEALISGSTGGTA